VDSTDISNVPSPALSPVPPSSPPAFDWSCISLMTRVISAKGIQSHQRDRTCIMRVTQNPHLSLLWSPPYPSCWAWTYLDYQRMKSKYTHFLSMHLQQPIQGEYRHEQATKESLSPSLSLACLSTWHCTSSTIVMLLNARSRPWGSFSVETKDWIKIVPLFFCLSEGIICFW